MTTDLSTRSADRQSFFLSQAVIFLTMVAGAALWLPLGPSDQELLANYAKAVDFWAGLQSVGSWIWWTPNFLGGTSLAPAWGSIFTSLWLLFWTELFGPITGGKVALLLCLPVAGSGAWLLARWWSDSPAMAGIAAVFYVWMPGLWLRMLAVEHVVVVCAFAVLPFVFFTVWLLASHPSLRHAVLAGAAFAFLALTYSKLAVILLPVLVLFWLGISWEQGSLREQFRNGIAATAAGSVFLLGVVPLLPSLRESSFLAFFEFGPFESWQRAFATKSPMQFFDRLGEISDGFDPSFAPVTAAGGYFPGSIWLLFLFLAIPLGRKLFQGGEGKVLRLSAALILFSFWLSFGPTNVWSAHWQSLRDSVGGADWTIVLLWGSLTAVLGLIYLLVPGRGSVHGGLVAFLSLVFFFLPGFLLLEQLPLFGQIRAPFDFFQIPAMVLLPVAGAVLVVRVWREISQRSIQIILAFLIFMLIGLDLAGFRTLAQKRVLGEQTWEDYLVTTQHLGNSSMSSPVFAFSGRYFPLLLPSLSGRSLTSEAFQMYLQQRGFAALLTMAYVTPELTRDIFGVLGVGEILSDVNDPDRSATMEERLVDEDELQFSNQHFEIFCLEDSLFPGFIGRDVVQIRRLATADYPDIVRAIPYSVIPLEIPVLNRLEDWFAGEIDSTGMTLREEIEKEGGRPFLRLPESALHSLSYQHFRIDEVPVEGWLVLTRAWHPDWLVSVDGEPRRLYRAFGALPAVQVEVGENLEFRFTPPLWYSLCAWTGVACWLLLPFALLLLRRLENLRQHLK